MIAPYQVAAPQGGLIESIMDFIGEKRKQAEFDRQVQTEMATQAAINAQMGYPSGVDPFGMQKFATGESNLKTAETNRNVTQGSFDLRKRAEDSTYNAAEAIGRGLQPGGASYGMYNRPDFNAMLPGATNPAVLQHIIGIMTGIEDNQRDMRDWKTKSTAEQQNRIEAQNNLGANQIASQAAGDARQTAADVAKEQRARGYQSEAAKAVASVLGWNLPQGGENLPLTMIPEIAQAQQERNSVMTQQVMEVIKALTASKEGSNPDALAGLSKVMTDLQTGQVEPQMASRIVQEILQRKQDEQKMIDNQKQMKDSVGRENLWNWFWKGEL